MAHYTIIFLELSSYYQYILVVVLILLVYSCSCPHTTSTCISTKMYILGVLLTLPVYFTLRLTTTPCWEVGALRSFPGKGSRGSMKVVRRELWSMKTCYFGREKKGEGRGWSQSHSQATYTKLVRDPG